MGSLSLSFLFGSLSLSGLSSSQAFALDTIHPLLQALISSLARPPFRVGFAGKLLPVSGYAWTPSSQGTVVVLLLGFGKGNPSRGERSAPDIPNQGNWFAIVAWHLIIMLSHLLG